MYNEQVLKDFFRFLKNHDVYDIYMASIGNKVKQELYKGELIPSGFLLSAFNWEEIQKKYKLPQYFWMALNDLWEEIIFTYKNDE